MYRIIGPDRQEHGPLSAEQIRQWIAAGRCDDATLVRIEGTNAWKPLILIREFEGALASASSKIKAKQPSVSGASAHPVPVSASPAAPRATSKGGTGKIVLLIVLVLALCGSGYYAYKKAMPAGQPGANNASQQNETIECRNHLQALFVKIRGYTVGKGDQFPHVKGWCDALGVKTNAAAEFHCPQASGKDCSYAMNRNLEGKKLHQVNQETILLFETNEGWNANGTQEALVSRKHAQIRGNGFVPSQEPVSLFLLVSGKVVSATEAERSSLRWTP